MKEDRDTAKGIILYDKSYRNLKNIYKPINELRIAVAHSVIVNKNENNAVKAIEKAIIDFKKLK